MGQYRRHVFVCTSGTTCPLSGSVAVDEQLARVSVVEEYRYVGPPGDNKIETVEAAG